MIVYKMFSFPVNLPKNSLILLKKRLKLFSKIRFCSSSESQSQDRESSLNCPNYMELSDDLLNEATLGQTILDSLSVHNDFITESEEQSIIEEVEPYMKRLRYEFDHWDDAIHGYRETERLQWNDKNTKILDRVRRIAFPPNVAQLKHVHILDLDKKGFIKPHIDAVRFCGDTIAGLSLLTDSVMRLVHEKNKNFHVDLLLKRRSLYIMKGTARYDYTHEILANEHSRFKGDTILKERRISVICRNEPQST